MKKLLTIIIGFVAFYQAAPSQDVGIGTDNPDAQSIIDIQSTDKGILIPRMTTAQRDLIGQSAADVGLLIYNTTDLAFNYWDGTQWVVMPAAGGGDGDWLVEGTDAVPTAVTDEIYHTGNVGIGMTTPDDRLDVQGSVQFNGDFINQEILGAHSGTVQSVPFTNLGFNPLTGTTVSITPQDGNGVNHSGVLITGFARVFGGSLIGNNSSIGSYFMVLERATDPGFAGATILTYTSGTCYLETPNGAVSASLAFGGGGHISYVDNNLTAGVTYYYRLTLVPNSVGITGGTFEVYQRDLNLIQIKR